MCDEMNCRECRARLTAYLVSDPESEDSPAVREHLRDCPSCRAALCVYFPLDRWRECGSPPDPVPAGLAAAVLASLEDGPIPPRDQRAGRDAPGRLLANYLAAAFATLVLLFTGCFGFPIDLAAPAGLLNEGARTINHEAQRLVEIRLDWRAIWAKIAAGRDHERSNEHDQE